MNLTELLIASILESVQSQLKVATLKLNANLNEESVKDIFSAEVTKAKETLEEGAEAEFNWEEVVEKLSADSEFDEVFQSIKGILDSIEGLEESAATQAVDLLAKGVTLAADNIAEGFEDKVAKAAEALEESIEEKVSAHYQEATQEWAAKKEQELKESLEYSDEDISALESAGRFVLALEKAFTDANLSFDTAITEKADKVEADALAIQNENSELKKEQGQRVKDDIFNNVMEELTDIDKDKLKSISESVVFINEKDYKEKMETMKDTFASKKKKMAEMDDDDEDGDKKDKKMKDKEESSKAKLGEEVSRLLGAKKL